MSSEIILAHRLAELFYPLVEVTVFDDQERIREVLNAFSTLKEDQEWKAEAPLRETLAVGKTVRCLIHPLKEGGYLRLRYDLTPFNHLQEQLNMLLQPEAKSGVMDQWKEAIDQMIISYLAENNMNLQSLAPKQKRELISKLQERGLLDFKESSSYIAAKLNVSRATVYNYLKTAADFKKVHVHQVDAFTSEKFGGNPAGVVLDADDLDEGIMRKIARELNLSETSFVLPSQKADFQMRYFTPTGHEIAFCGHSTVGALYMIAKERIQKAGEHAFKVETSCGVLKMEVSIDDEEEIKVAYEAPSIQFKKTKFSHQQIAKAVGIDLEIMDQAYPVMVEATNKDLFVVVKSLKDLKKIECDLKSLTQFCKQHDIVALCLFCPEAIDEKNQFHMRCYAPMVGIPEDPFTGSVLGGLTAYVDTFGLLAKGKSEFRVEQGHFLERPGVVHVQFSKKQGQYHAKVFAQAVHCFSTEIQLK